MLYIILTILISVFLLVIFKIFPKYGVNTLVAIVFNYFTAAITGIIFLKTPFTINEIATANWMRISLPLGALFMGVFYLISLTAQKISVATASVANKMSVVMPIVFSLGYLHEQLSFLKIVGIFLAVIALYLVTKPNQSNAELKKLIWLPILVFFGSGLIDITINHVNLFYLTKQHHNALFTLTSFFCAFCFGVLCLGILVLSKKIKLSVLAEPKNIIAGILLGIPNYFSIYFIFKSLDSHVFKSALLFPVLNLSNVVVAAIIAVLWFKEKMSVFNIVGIFLAVIAIIVIAF